MSTKVTLDVLNSLIEVIESIINDGSVYTDYDKIQSFISEKQIISNRTHNKLINRVDEAKRRLNNANILLVATKFQVNNNSSSEESKVAQCQAGLNAALKNLETYEEVTNYQNKMIEDYMLLFNKSKSRFNDYLPELLSFLRDLKKLVVEYINIINKY